MKDTIWPGLGPRDIAGQVKMRASEYFLNGGLL